MGSGSQRKLILSNINICMHTRKLYTSLFLLLLFISLFFLKDHFTGALYQDEHHYLPAAVTFSEEPIPSISLSRLSSEDG
jgi:hypothetical protein